LNKSGGGGITKAVGSTIWRKKGERRGGQKEEGRIKKKWGRDQSQERKVHGKGVLYSGGAGLARNLRAAILKIVRGLGDEL